MKKTLFFCIAAMVFAGCNRAEIDNAISLGLPKVWAGVDNADTKTFVDDGLTLHWNAGDKIDVAFANEDYQNVDGYTFSGTDGATEGDFTPPSGSSVEPSFGKDLAYFPPGLKRGDWYERQVSVRMWESQDFTEGSFGPEDNPMLAVSTEKDGKLFFPFKNVCGYLVLRLYGKVEVSEVLLEGNNGETLAGDCYIYMDMEKNVPSMSWSWSTGAFLEKWIVVSKKGGLIELGKTPENATEIWFVVPPTDFKKGFTITVRGPEENQEMTISSPRERKITRNVVNRMAPVEVVYDEDFDDVKFRTYCMENFDKDKDGELSESEALAVTKIDCRGLGINSLKGIGRFKNLEVLRCGTGYDNESRTTLYNNIVGSLDLSVFTNLRVADCSKNSITSLTVGNLKNLDSLVCNSNQIASLDVSGLENMTMLDCSSNKLTALDVTMLEGLKNLSVSNNDLRTFDYSHNTSLISLYMGNCGLTSVDVSMLPALKFLGVSGNTLGDLDVSNNHELEDLTCEDCGLSSLDLSQLTKLNSFVCSYNSISVLDVRQCSSLQFIFASNNQLQSIIIGEKNTGLWYVNVTNNDLSGEFDLSYSKDAKMFMLNLRDNAITKLWLPEGFGGYLHCDIKDSIEIGYK